MSRQSGDDTSSRPLTGTAARHVTALPSDRGETHHVVASYQGTIPSLRLSVVKFFFHLPIQPVVSIPSKKFFFLFDYRIRHCAHFDTYPSGAFGSNGFHGESAWPETELGFLRTHWIIGPPFVDRKSLATMSDEGDVGGFVFKTFVSIITFLGYVGNKPCWQSVVDKTL
jgi:hypothetical protein